MNGSRGSAAGLVLGGIVSIQLGAAFAVGLFDDVGASGTVFLRIAIAALILLAIWRPSFRLGDTATRRDVALFGLIFAGMNASFYLSLERIPLGIAVTLEFAGPLGLALLRSRRRLDLAWVGLAGAGLILLAPVPGGSLDALGCALALFAGLCWGAYIVISARVGKAIPGGGGLALAMAIAAVLVAPAGLIDAGGALVDGGLLLAALGVAILSSVLPYSLELEALRRLPEGVFGVLMSLEPAVATAVGFVILDQDLAARELLAVGLVLSACAGALSAAGSPRAPEA